MAKISSKNKIDFFIRELGARKPSPGGGAAAALTGALGAALIMKAANFTIGKKKLKKYEKEAKEILKKAAKLEERLKAHIEKDAKSYSEYSKTKNRFSIKKATACVAQIAALSKESLKLCGRLKKIGNVNLKGDLMAAELFLGASARAAENLVNLNKKWMGR